jgi:DNA mismatch repair ATPase MutL
MNDLKTYGYRGEALYNIISLSEEFNIISRKTCNNKTVCKTIKTKLSTIQNLKNPLFDKGTQITILNLFHNIPIKQQQVNEYDEIKSIRKFFEQISLFYYDISMTVVDLFENKVLFQSVKTNSIKSQFGNLFGIDFHGFLKPYLLDQCKKYEIKGLFSIYSHSIALQFIYLNKYLISNTNLYNLVNKKLSVVNMCPKNKPNSKYPSYLILISCPDSFFCLNDNKNSKTAVFVQNDLIILLLQQLVDKFLTGEGFRLSQNSSESSEFMGFASFMNTSHDHIQDALMSKLVRKVDSIKTNDLMVNDKTIVLKRKLKHEENVVEAKKLRNSRSSFSISNNDKDNFDEIKAVTEKAIHQGQFCSWFDLFGQKVQQKKRSKSLVFLKTDILSTFEKDEDSGISNCCLEEELTLNEVCLTRDCGSIKNEDSVCESSIHVDDSGNMCCSVDENNENKSIWHNLFVPFKPRTKSYRSQNDHNNEGTLKNELLAIENILVYNTSNNKWRNKEDLSLFILKIIYPLNFQIFLVLRKAHDKLC